MPLVIGVDESGKGDFFGPLVVAAFLGSDDDIPELRAMGVRDSKLIADGKLLKIDEELRGRFPYASIVCPPEDYNTRYKTIRNLNKLLAQGHAEAISTVFRSNRADLAISDKFGKPELVEGALRAIGCPVKIEQVVRGEAIAQVAASSILARAEFVRQMSRMSSEYGVEFPKGAGSIVDKAGRAFVSRFGAHELVKVSKLHFKNYSRVISVQLFS